MIKTLVTNREWGKFSHTQVASAVKACLGRAEVAKRLLFISFAVVASFVGQTAHAQNVQPTATWEGSTPSAANGQTVYLYNVGTKQYLGKGGRWGTEATMNVEGTPFTLTYNSSAKTFTLTSKVKQQAGDSGGKLTLMDGTTQTSSHDKFDYFVDGNVKASENHTFTANGSTTDGYTLAITSTSASTSSMSGKTFYMFAEGAYGHVSARLKTATSTMLGIPSDSTAYSKWVIVTEKQREDAFKTVNMAHVPVVNATFLMSDFDFARKDDACSAWKTGATADGSTTGELSYKGNKPCKPEDAYTKTYTYTSTHVIDNSGNTHTSTFTTTEDLGETHKEDRCKDYNEHSNPYTALDILYRRDDSKTVVTTGYTYYLGNGYIEGDVKTDFETGETFTGKGQNLQLPYGGAWTANIHGARGSVVQTIDGVKLVKEGWYRISCLGFTTTKKGIARLFAAAGMGNTGSNATAQSRKFATDDLARIDAAKQPKTYVAASTLLDGSTEGAYDASVMVYVGDNSTGNKESLSFGIEVGGADDPTQDADATAWTCFDNFKIEYLGIPKNPLILDEDQTDAGYIKAQTPYLENNATLQKSEVYLHRTMNPGTWNSLVLPINLNVGQVMRIFGSQVRVSEFKGACDKDHPQRIIFDPISADQNDPDAIAIEAGKLYLVKPTADHGMPTNQEEKTFKKDGYNISVKDYYTIVGVTFKRKNDIADDAYSGRVMGTTGDEELGTNQKVQFVGTYVKCFDNDLIPANSYVLNGNNKGGTAGLWYYRTAQTKTKGFRGWLQPANGQPAKGIEYEIEGVVDQVNGDATAIDGIEAEQQHNANIYNLNGQLVRQGATSTEGLPSGLYIVGGKKVVVK